MGWRTWRIVAAGVVAFLTLVPVTLPVPILRELVQERFAVSDFLTSLFMSVNMIGAALSAPIAGALGDRFGRRPAIVVGALLLDALAFVGLALAPHFGLFLAIRFLEGCTHIVALSMVLSLASGARGEAYRGRIMGMVGGGMLLGVAIGAPLGSVIGRSGPLAPLYAGAAVSVGAALLAALVLREHGRESESRPGLRAILPLIRSTPQVALPLLFAFADRFTVGFYTTTFTLYLRNVHDVSSAHIGPLIAVFMLPFALFSVPFGWVAERGSLAWLLCGGSLLYGLGTASLTWWHPDALMWLMFALGITAAVMFVPSLVMTTKLSAESVRTTALGAFNAAGSLGFIVGPMAGGLVTELAMDPADPVSGYRAAFLVAGASEIALATLALVPLRRLEKRFAVEAEPA
ncbi:MAG: MFS transporter [Myxococcota bacterium]|nr:MFS transporter [Myxococcota bacterium]